MFKKILVPLDGSLHSVRALENAIGIAKKFNSKLTLLHAYSTNLLLLPKKFVRPESTPAIVEISRDIGVNILAAAEIKTKDEKVQVETLLKGGHAVKVILDVCKNGNFDLIVIGARGLSVVKEILLGSVSQGVTRHAVCPVLVVK